MGRGHNSHRQLLKRRWFKRLLYQVTRGFLLRPLSRRYFDMHIVGRERIPDEPCVIATHHCLSFDWAVMGAILDRKAHGWIDADVFARVRTLASLLELISVNTGGGPISREGHRTTMETSGLWLENTDDFVVIVTDGPSIHCVHPDGAIMQLAERPSHSGAASVAAEANVAIVTYSSLVPDPHARELFLSKGIMGDLRYLERHRRIRYWGEFAEPLHPASVAGRHELRDKIRASQLATWERLRARARP